MKKRNLPLLALCLLLVMMLAACGSDTESAESETSSVEDTASEEEDSEETASDEEDSAEEEEEEPTADEIFSEMIENREGICLKLRVYNQKGTPVRYGLVTLTEGDQEIQADTDYDGYALITDLLLDTEYAVTVSDRNEELVGEVQMTIIEGDTYAGALREDGEMVLSVPDGDTSVADLSIVATDENAEDSAFDCYSIEAWEYNPEDDEEDSEEDSEDAEETEDAEEAEE